MCSNICLCVLQEELRPEYEEALQEKKDKMKALSKKKVLYLIIYVRLRYNLINSKCICGFSLCVFIIS